MYVPNTPDRSWRKAARRRLLGDDRPGPVIITPMRTIHRSLRQADEGGELTGWLQAITIGAARAVLCPPGTGVTDVVAAQEPGSTIVLVGLCGALADIPIGSVLIVERARTPDGAWHRPGLPIEEASLRSVSNVQVSSLIESFQRHDELRLVAETVDMECGSVLATAERCGVRAAAILVVSDRNRDPGVFDSRIEKLWGPISAACDVARAAVADADLPATQCSWTAPER